MDRVTCVVEFLKADYGRGKKEVLIENKEKYMVFVFLFLCFSLSVFSYFTPCDSL